MRYDIYFNHGKPWSKKDLLYLQFAVTISGRPKWQEICRHLGRTITACWAQYQKIRFYLFMTQGEGEDTIKIISSPDKPEELE